MVIWPKFISVCLNFLPFGIPRPVFINNFSSHYKRKYGKPVGKIALDRGVPCPNRQAGGCVFCAPRSFRPYYLNQGEELHEQIRKGKKFLKRKKCTYYFAYFQQETTTAAPCDELLNDFRAVLSDPLCIGIIISTRPDYLEDRLLDELNGMAGDLLRPKEIILELGLQSGHDRSLTFLNRNHTCADFIQAVDRVKARKYLQVGVHLILGIPEEDYADMLHTVHLVCEAGVEHLKIHHLQVIKGTELEKMYQKRPFPVFDVDAYVDLVSRLLMSVPKSVIVHRLWSLSEKGIIVAPCWDLSTFEMAELLMKELCETGRRQGKLMP